MLIVRRTVVGLAILAGSLAFLALFGHAQPVPPGFAKKMADLKGSPKQGVEANEFSHALGLPTDNKLQKRLEAAEDFVREEQWGDAAKVLQMLLDAKEDVFVQVTRKDTSGKPSQQWTSVKAEANRLLAALPANGRDFYELQYGAVAQNRLAEARKDNNPHILGEVAQRYQNTKAGLEATALLGSYHLDRGRFVMAALCYERLLGRDGLDKLPPATLFRALLAFQRVGDKPAGDHVRKLLLAAGREGVKIGGELITLADVDRVAVQFNTPLRQLLSPYDWTLFGGNVSRSAQGTGGTPFMDRTWARPLAGTNDTDTWINQALEHQKTRGRPILSGHHPIAVSIRRLAADGSEQTVPLVVFRDYAGLQAYDLRTGELEWRGKTHWSLDSLSESAGGKHIALNNWIQFYLNSDPSMLWENSTLGSLSSDGRYVYAVEDLALPPHPHFMQQHAMGGAWGGGQQPAFGELRDAVEHSKLVALELGTGKVAWELGGRNKEIVAANDKKDEKKDDLKDTYFLGPPLPIGGRLYVLTERQNELRLVCVDPPREVFSEPTVAWSQTLATTREKILVDVSRRIRCAALSYGDGILVCPTNAGAVLGVDLLSRSLVWAHAYREKSKDSNGQEEMIMGMGRQRIIMRGGMVPPQPNAPAALNADWKTTAPIISDGRVVVAAPDGDAVHCLNLRDGRLQWRAGRKDDLYLAGVYGGKVLLVGEKSTRALSLNDGTQLWSVETGQPSGLGVAGEGVYYLPLRAGFPSREPEVCSIDIQEGKILAHTRSRTKDVPGNLLFHEGFVVSQTPTDLAVYPQLKVKLQQIDERIARNPKDPIGLTERGELKLDKGDLPGAIADLSLALANTPPPELLPKTRSKLFETLTEQLHRDFAAGEKHLAEYEQLCRVTPAALAATVKPDDRPKLEAEAKLAAERETRRRQTNFYCLLAKGREKQGRLTDAFDAYLAFGRVAVGEELVNVVDEPSVRAPADVWAQGRIAAMVRDAQEADRRPLQDRIAAEWRAVREAGELERLRAFVAMFGSLFTVGQEARLVLAERLLQDGPTAALLEAERHLFQLRAQGQPELAARAVEGLARLYTRKGLLDDAAHCYRLLGRQFPTVAVRDGKTGGDLFATAAADPRYLPFLGATQTNPVAPGRFDVRERTGTFPDSKGYFYFEMEGELLPGLRRVRVALDQKSSVLKLVDRQTGEDLWSHAAQKTTFSSVVLSSGQAAARFPCHVVGHLGVLPLGNVVFGIDLVGKQLLWEKSLTGQTQVNTNQSLSPDPRDGSMQLLYSDGWKQRLGRLGAVQMNYICLQTREGLEALDPHTGRTLWKRTGVAPGSHLFGDADHVYVVEYPVEDKPGATPTTRCLRASDGVTVVVPDFAALYQRRQRVLGRTLLLTDESAEGVVLRLYDVHTGKDLLRENCPARTVLLGGDTTELAGVVEPEGRVRLFDLAQRKEVLKTKIDDVRELDKVQGGVVLQDAAHYYVGLHAPPDTSQIMGGPWPNLDRASGMRSVPVNGMFYAFQRDKGTRTWKKDARNLMVVLEQFEELPFVLFTSRYQKAIAGQVRGQVMVQPPVMIGGVPQQAPQGASRIVVVAKRSGKLVYEPDEAYSQALISTLQRDPRTGQVDLLSHNTKVTLTGPQAEEPKQP